jgi:hypothetical protein
VADGFNGAKQRLGLTVRLMARYWSRADRMKIKLRIKFPPFIPCLKAAEFPAEFVKTEPNLTRGCNVNKERRTAQPSLCLSNLKV